MQLMGHDVYNFVLCTTLTGRSGAIPHLFMVYSKRPKVIAWPMHFGKTHAWW